jgi:hypothetical protein
MAMTGLILFGAATYDAPYGYDYDPDYGSPYDQYYTTLYSGATQNWSMILPSGPGISGQVLATDGTGITYWTTGGGGTPGGSNGDIQFNNGSGGFGGSTFLWSAANNQLTDVVGSTSITLGNVFPLFSIAGFSVGIPFSGGAGAALFYEPGGTVGISIADGAGDVISSNILGGVPNFLVENTSGLFIQIQPGMISGSTGATLALDNSDYTTDGFFLGDDLIENTISGGNSVGGISISTIQASLFLSYLGTFSLGNGGSAVITADASNNLTIGGFVITLDPSVGVEISSPAYLSVGGALRVNAVLQDGTSSVGTLGQLLTSTVSATAWGWPAVSGSPTSSGTGAPGQLQYDSTYLYICYATNSWGRIAFATGY